MRITRDPYFDWLCIMIDARNYYKLAKSLHETEFRAKLPEDNNRAMDGMHLRVEFIEMHGEYGSATNRRGCTMLEFLIGIARHMGFLMSGMRSYHRIPFYFWLLIRNLRLDKLTDDNWDILNGDFYVEDAVDRVMNRQYDPNGQGGLFPLRGNHGDQRCVEIWYQMHTWLGENCDAELEI